MWIPDHVDCLSFFSYNNKNTTYSKNNIIFYYFSMKGFNRKSWFKEIIITNTYIWNSIAYNLDDLLNYFIFYDEKDSRIIGKKVKYNWYSTRESEKSSILHFMHFRWTTSLSCKICVLTSLLIKLPSNVKIPLLQLFICFNKYNIDQIILISCTLKALSNKDSFPFDIFGEIHTNAHEKLKEILIMIKFIFDEYKILTLND